MCTERYHFVAFGCMKIPNFVRDGRKFPFRADGREKNEGGSLGVKKGRGIAPFCQDRRTTMTVSVTQEQMRQNSFHHTLTVPLSSALVALRGRTEEPSLCLWIFFSRSQFSL